MNKEEIQEYLEKVDNLGKKLEGIDKETFDLMIYGYNQCAKMLHETEQELDQYKNNWEELKKELKTAYSELFEHELINGREVIENILNEMKELEEKNND